MGANMLLYMIVVGKMAEHGFLSCMLQEAHGGATEEREVSVIA